MKRKERKIKNHALKLFWLQAKCDKVKEMAITSDQHHKLQQRRNGKPGSMDEDLDQRAERLVLMHICLQD